MGSNQNLRILSPVCYQLHHKSKCWRIILLVAVRHLNQFQTFSPIRLNSSRIIRLSRFLLLPEVSFLVTFLTLPHSPFNFILSEVSVLFNLLLLFIFGISLPRLLMRLLYSVFCLLLDYLYDQYQGRPEWICTIISGVLNPLGEVDFSLVIM